MHTYRSVAHRASARALSRRPKEGDGADTGDRERCAARVDHVARAGVQQGAADIPAATAGIRTSFLVDNVMPMGEDARAKNMSSVESR